MNKESGIKIPRVLAITETTTRQSFKSQLSLFTEHDIVPSLNQTKKNYKSQELHKALFEFNNKEAIVFDGLCKLCMDAYDKKHINLISSLKGTEKESQVIERQDESTETHYRTVLSLEEAKWLFCGDKYEAYWDYVFTNIKKLAYARPKKRRLILGKNSYIDTEPLRIDFVYEDGSGLKKLANLSPRRKGKNKEEREIFKRHTGGMKQKIVGFVIEFYKPLFYPIIETSKNNKPGKNYIRQPPFLQLGIIDEVEKTINAIKKAEQNIEPALKKAINTHAQSETFTKDEYDSGIKCLQTRAKIRLDCIQGISRIEIRNFFNYLALHDNMKADFITIKDLKDFASRCFERLTRLDRAGERQIYPSQYEELIEQKIKPILYIYKNMALHGKMDGGQLVPCDIIFENTETGEIFGRETNSLRIKCLKSKSLYSTYTDISSKDELIELARTLEPSQITDKTQKC